MGKCKHENAKITLFEEKMTRYQLRGGKVVETNDNFEAELLSHVDVSCPDCQLYHTYPDWTKAPDPIPAYCQAIFNHERIDETDQDSKRDEQFREALASIERLYKAGHLSDMDVFHLFNGNLTTGEE